MWWLVVSSMSTLCQQLAKNRHLTTKSHSCQWVTSRYKSLAHDQPRVALLMRVEAVTRETARRLLQQDFEFWATERLQSIKEFASSRTQAPLWACVKALRKRPGCTHRLVLALCCDEAVSQCSSVLLFFFLHSFCMVSSSLTDLVSSEWPQCHSFNSH